MTVIELLALVVSSLTAIAVAWIGLRQQQVRRTLDEVNGHVQHSLDRIEQAFVSREEERPTP